MPQLEQLHTFTSQIFWLFFSLGIVYFFLSKYAVPRLSKVIELRETTISTDINSAEQFKNKAEEISEEFSRQLEVSRTESMSITATATKEASALYDKSMAETDMGIKKSVEASEKEIILARDKAMGELESNISAFVNDIVEKVAGIKVEKIKVEKLLKTGS